MFIRYELLIFSAIATPLMAGTVHIINRKSQV